jgi:ribose transport system ATP-binding protein
VEAQLKVLVQIEGLTKTFAGGRALDNLDLTIGRGEVLALVGQNGCGKSTLIKIMSGYHQPDPGYFARFDGLDFRLGDPAAPGALGVHFVHQDLGLLDDLSAVENLAIGTGFSTGRGGRIRWDEQEEQARVAMAALGYDFDVTLSAGALSPSERVGIAIARAVASDDGRSLNLLVLDEPTASLPKAEVDILFAAVRRLREAGTSVLFVSHRLDEVFDIADRATVMRDGRRVATTPVVELDSAGLIEQILGRPVEHVASGAAATRHVSPLLSVRSLGGRHLRSLDLDLFPGEVLGVAGLTGSGREELGPLLFGAQRRTGGSLEVDGRPVARLDPSSAKGLGMALVPANRRVSAVLPDSTVRENLTIAGLKSLVRRLHLRRRAERAEVTTWLDALHVKPRDGEASILNLSGGNQQKVLLARWLRLQPRIFVLDEPTHGVDVGTKPEIHALLRRIAREGAAVIVCSTDSEEIVEVSDRAIVLTQGVIHTELSGAALTLDRLNHEILAA